MNTHGWKTEVICQSEPWFRRIKFWMRKTEWTPDRTTYAIAQPMTFITADPAESGISMPEAFSLSETDAQALMDELWHVGLRPSEGSGSSGSLAATQKHLEDMRSLVFDKPKP